MVTPIKRELLIHSVKYTPPLDDTGWDEPQPESQPVDNVRVEPKSSLYVDSAGKQVKANSILFWDSIHSDPCDFDIDGKIEFDGQVMTIVEINEFYDSHSLHHVELVLI